MNNIVSIINEVEPRFQEMASKKDMQYWMRECMYVKQIISSNGYLQKLAENNPESFQDAILHVASLNITLNPAFSYAYLIPRNGKVCLDISYKGLLYIAQREGRIKYAFTDAVKEGDTFEYNGKMNPPNHSFDPFIKSRCDSKIIGAYCSAKLYDDTWMIEVIDKSEILKIMGCSTSKDKNVWKMWPEEMAKKSVIKRASKLWPIKNYENSKLEEAIRISNESESFDLKKTKADEINEILE